MKDRKKFNHTEKFQFQHIDTKTIDIGGKDGRGYIVGDKVYPSITTVLSINNKEHLDAWRKRVGDEEANRISKMATDNGSAVHQLCEDYLNNKELSNTSNWFSYNQFKALVPIIDERIDNIVCQEAALYSNKYRTAGRVDCIAEFDGKLSIIDFKTSKRIKTMDQIENYFIQETFYAYSFYEMHKEVIEQIVTIMTVEHDQPLVFIKSPFDYIEKFEEVRKRFYQEFKI